MLIYFMDKYNTVISIVICCYFDFLSFVYVVFIVQV